MAEQTDQMKFVQNLLLEVGRLRTRVEIESRHAETLERRLRETLQSAEPPPTVIIDDPIEPRRAGSSLHTINGTSSGYGALLSVTPPAAAVHQSWWPRRRDAAPALEPPPGWRNYGLRGRTAKVVGVSVCGLTRDNLERAVASIADEQAQLRDFIPVFLTDSTDFDIFRKYGFVFEYLPSEASRRRYGGKVNWSDYAAKRRALIEKKWGLSQVICIGPQEFGRISSATTVPADARSPSGELRNGSKPKTTAALMQRKLWAGFSRPALRELEQLKRSSSAKERFEAAWALARWHVYHGEHLRALDQVALMRALDPKQMGGKHVLLLETECLLKLGHAIEARQLLDKKIAVRGGFDADLCLAYANSYASSDDPSADDMRLEWINRVFIKEGFAPIVKADPAAPLSIDNLAAPTAARVDLTEPPKVSVIMAAYNAAASIRMAIESLLAQTWPQLEIIVVDDHSTDETFDIIRALARDHESIVPVRLGRNQGAYAARNAGLSLVSGELITTHDADDWSHPQRIEALARAMVARPSILGSVSSWARAMRNLYFPGPWRPDGLDSSLIVLSLSSYLFRQRVKEMLGAWDQVRVSADREFRDRAEATFGADAVVRMYNKVPLAFALLGGNSLTGHRDTHIRTQFHGVRRDYLDAARWWREQVVDVSHLKIRPNDRPFPAPHRMLPDQSERSRYDYLFVMDFIMIGGTFVSVMNDILSCVSRGKRVAVFHWPRFNINAGQRLNPQVWALAADGKLDVISPGDRIAADMVIIRYPPILQYRIDDPPVVDFRDLIVVVNQLAYRLQGNRDEQYDPRDVRRTLQETFGTEGLWVPISGLVSRLMIENGNYPPPHNEPWLPLIDTPTYSAEPLIWRGRIRDQPVIGRHGRDHYTKWPADPQALLDAYCAERPCTVRLLGGAEKALKIISAIPSNWVIHAFDSMSPLEFLRDIDFFVHYPHEDYIEEFGRAVAEAMAVGRPVILPPVFEETFESAALYAEPSEVWDVVSALWRDEEAYLERARTGRDFVNLNCSPNNFEERIMRIRATRKGVNDEQSLATNPTVKRRRRSTRANGSRRKNAVRHHVQGAF